MSAQLPEIDPKPPTLTWVKKTRDLIGLLEISPTTFYEFVKMPGFPARVHGQGYALEPVLAFIKRSVAGNEKSVLPLKVERLSNSLKESITSEIGSIDLAALKARELLAKCKKLETQVAVERGEFIDRSIIREWLTKTAKELVGTLRKKLEHEVPHESAMRDAADIQTINRKALNESFETFYERIAAFGPRVAGADVVGELQAEGPELVSGLGEEVGEFASLGEEG